MHVFLYVCRIEFIPKFTGFFPDQLRVWGLILPCPVKALDTVVIDIPSSRAMSFGLLHIAAS